MRLGICVRDGYSDDPVEVAELGAHLAALGVPGVNLEDSTAGRAGHPHLHARTVVPEEVQIVTAGIGLPVNVLAHPPQTVAELGEPGSGG